MPIYILPPAKISRNYNIITRFVHLLQSPDGKELSHSRTVGHGLQYEWTTGKFELDAAEFVMTSFATKFAK